MQKLGHRWWKVLAVVMLIGLSCSLFFLKPSTSYAISEWSGNQVSYKVGDLVTYQGSTYKCIQAHTSLPNWDPPSVPALWQFVSSGPTPGTTPTATPTRTPNPTPTSTTSPTPTPTTTPTPPPTNKINVTYFQQWAIYARNYFVKNIDTSGSASKLTAINYAFSNMSSDLKCSTFDSFADWEKTFAAGQAVSGVADTWDQPLAGNFNQLKELKAKYPHLKILMSLGGWTLSKHFSDAALPQNVAAYAQSCIDMYIKGNLPGHAAGAAAGIFDGIDIDWEYPASPGDTGNVVRPEDTQNFTGLLAEFRRQLDTLGAQTGKHYLLTIAAPSGQDKYSKIQLGSIGQYLDWINLMTYDMHGAWDTTGPTDIMAPLYCDPNDPYSPPAKNYCVDNAVKDYLAAGIPASKLTIGIPFYGRGWTNVPNANNGLYQTSSNMGPAPGTYSDAPGVNDYKVLAALGYPGFRSSVTQGFWIFNGSTFWSYDDATSVATKVSYLKSKGLGGVMSWAIDGDDGTLMTTIYNGLTH